MDQTRPFPPKSTVAATRMTPATVFAFAVFFVTFLMAGSAQANTFRTGVSLFDTISVGDAQHASEKIRSSGGSFTVIWLRWNEVAPTTKPEVWNPADPNDPNYNWTTADQWVKGAIDGGVTPVVQVFGAPAWANRCQPETGTHVLSGAPCNPDPAEFAEFLKAAATRYSGSNPGLPRVRYWQLQNEPNLHLFFNPQSNAKGQPVSPGIYRNLLKAGYSALKSVSTSNIVAAGGLAPNKPAGSKSLAPLHFARELFCLNSKNRPKANSSPCKGGVPLDMFDMHPYTSGGPTYKALSPGNVQMGNLGQLQATLQAADRAGHTKGNSARTPLWITEMAWDSNRPDPGGVPMNLLRRWTAEAMFRSYQAGVRVFMWYSIRDRDPAGRPWAESDQSGLYFRGATMQDDRPKPIIKAFEFPFVSFPRGKKMAFVWGRTAQSTAGQVAIQRLWKGKWRKIGVAKANKGGLFRKNLQVRFGSNRAGTLRAVYKGRASVPFSLKKHGNRPGTRPFG